MQYLNTPTFSSANFSGSTSGIVTLVAQAAAGTPTILFPTTSGTLVIGGGTCSGACSNTNTGDQTSVSGNAGTATTLQTARSLWGQSFNGSADITGSLTGVGDITGGASSMTITAGTGNSRTLIFKTTTSGGTATTALTLAADQSATFASTVTATLFSGPLDASSYLQARSFGF